jgi:hypothetical protein
MAQSIEPNIADLANGWLKSYKLDYKLEQESLNAEIDKALSDYFTKNVGSGANDGVSTCPVVHRFVYFSAWRAFF